MATLSFATCSIAESPKFMLRHGSWYHPSFFSQTCCETIMQFMAMNTTAYNQSRWQHVDPQIRRTHNFVYGLTKDTRMCMWKTTIHKAIHGRGRSTPAGINNRRGMRLSKCELVVYNPRCYKWTCLETNANTSSEVHQCAELTCRRPTPYETHEVCCFIWI